MALPEEVIHSGRVPRIGPYSQAVRVGNLVFTDPDAFDPENQTSDLVLLDAAHIDADPVAVIRLPQRVPQGLHGNWIAKT